MTTHDPRDEAAKLRASDAERAATADLLRRHHAEGRLDTDELEERIELCYAAKTRGELDALTADLPGTRRRQPRVPRDHRRAPRVPVALLAIAAIVAVAATTHAPVLWLIWPLAFFVFGPFRRRYGWRRVP
jgi:Domain of unknown function (DUF1707)